MMDTQDAAKRVFIAYGQLSEILKEHIGFASAEAHVASYDRILDTLKQCFTVDKAFLEAIQHLQPLTRVTDRLSFKMESDSKVLLATAHSFIEMYLSPDEKKKTVGFHA